MSSPDPPQSSAPHAAGEVAAAEARTELRRLLSSPHFHSSERRKALLAYLVEQTLDEPAGGLKEFSIGIAVFGRNETFDPRIDPVVRLAVHRLRHDLDEFYRGPGLESPLRIAIPKGYKATFERRDPGSSSQGSAQADASSNTPAMGDSPPLHATDSNAAGPLSRLWLVFGAIAVVLVVLLALARELTNLLPIAGHSPAPVSSRTESRRGPIVALSAIRDMNPDPKYANFAVGFTQQLVGDLVRFDDLRVISPSGVKTYDDGINTIRNLRDQLGADYVLQGSTSATGENINLALELIDTKTSQVVWAETFMPRLAPDELFGAQRDISTKVAATIGSHYGAVLGSRLPLAQAQQPARFSSYHCVLQYYALVIALSAARHLQVRSCLEQTVKNEPDYATAWAVLANVYAQEYRFDFNPRPDKNQSLELSLDAARRAVLLEPQNPTARIMLALSAFDRHDLDEFRRNGDLAVDLNRNDPDVLGQYGLRLAYIGDWDRGEAFLRKAMELNPAHPVWYREPIAFIRYQRGDYTEALQEIDKYAYSNPNFIWYPVFRAMTLGQLDRGAEAGPSIDAILRIRPDFREAFWQMARVWNVPEQQIANMAAGLRKAGLDVVLPEGAAKASSP